MNITEKIKSYEDACKALGLNPESIPVVEHLPEKDRLSIIAYYKLTVIIRALNEGWVPNWNDTDEYKYYPWFYIEPNNSGATAGLSCANTRNSLTNTNASFGSRLCFKTSALARYAGKTFTELYTQFLIN